MHNAASTDLRDTGFWDEFLRPASARTFSSVDLANRRILITGAGGSIGSAYTINQA
jgi:FlaA1/EpsC-like NDP-sugar epimerase